jgi:hypothetical protein
MATVLKAEIRKSNDLSSDVLATLRATGALGMEEPS